MIWCRLFDGKLLDLIEMGIENAIPMTDFKVSLEDRGREMCFGWDRKKVEG